MERLKSEVAGISSVAAGLTAAAGVGNGLKERQEEGSGLSPGIRAVAGERVWCADL